MKIRMCAANLLGLDDPKHPTIITLADAMKISRYQLMHFLNDDSPQISKSILEAVCKYLVEERLVGMDEIFHRLFVIEPESFWPLLAARKQINFSVGARKKDQFGYEQFVVAADAALQSVMVHQLTGSCSSPKASDHAPQRDPGQVIDSQLVLSWKSPNVPDAAVQREANAYYRRCVRRRKDSAIVCLGSIKSNPACEPLVAHGFRGAHAFRSEDNVRRLAERSCPFVMIYRDEDPHPDSCWAGNRLAKDDPRRGAGIYYTCRPGEWDYAPCGDLEDAALVYYRFHKVQQSLESVWGGYSGRSTRLLAEMLQHGEADKFWPPAVENRRVAVGVFIVRFAFRPRRKDEDVQVRPRKLRNKPEVIALPKETIEPLLR